MKSTKELKLKYPKCYLPLHAMKTKKIVGYKNRPSVKVWWDKICKN